MKTNQKTILIVDDEPEIRSLMQDILTEEGYLTLAVESAKQAQIIISENPPDLVYLDIWMPQVDGVTLLKEWSETNQLSFPVIMISGHATIETAVEATKFGAFDFIEKPLSIEKLVVSAEKALSESIRVAGQEIALLLKNNCTAYTDTFLALDSESKTNQILFLRGEVGLDKKEFARYIHLKKYKGAYNFINFQLNLLVFDQLDNERIASKLLQTINTLDEGTIFLSGYSESITEHQTQALNFLKNLTWKQALNLLLGSVLTSKIKRLSKMRD